MRGKGRGTPSPTPSPSKKPNSAASKLMRKWGDTSSSVTAEDMASLDYSTPPPPSNGDSTPVVVDTESLVSAEAMGVRTSNGYEVADWDYRREELPTEEEILARATGKLDLSGEEEEAGGSKWTDVFSRLTGKKTLTQEDLKPVLAEMERNLMDKNVAKDIAEKMCESVGAALVGKKLGGLTSKSKNDGGAVSSTLLRAEIQVSRQKSKMPFPHP